MRFDVIHYSILSGLANSPLRMKGLTKYYRFYGEWDIVVLINDLAPLLENEIIERAEKLNSTTIADAMGRNAVMDYQIKPVTKKSEVIGTALTVSLRAGDNLFLHQAIYDGKEGYVLVVDGNRHLENAYLGELMALAAGVQKE